MQHRRSLKSSAALLILLCPWLSSCGSDKKDDPAPTVVYGKITVTSAKDDDSGTYELTSLAKCSRNVESGVVDISMSQGAGKPNLILAIRDYNPTTARSYTCAQSGDNNTSTDIGSRFSGCMVSTAVLSGPTATTLNVYSMHREKTEVKAFDYAGACSIQVTQATPTIKATVSCTKMIQTQLDGTVRNPLDTSATADLTAEVNCTFQ